MSKSTCTLHCLLGHSLTLHLFVLTTWKDLENDGDLYNTIASNCFTPYLKSMRTKFAVSAAGIAAFVPSKSAQQSAQPGQLPAGLNRRQRRRLAAMERHSKAQFSSRPSGTTSAPPNDSTSVSERLAPVLEKIVDGMVGVVNAHGSYLATKVTFADGHSLMILDPMPEQKAKQTIMAFLKRRVLADGFIGAITPVVRAEQIQLSIARNSTRAKDIETVLALIYDARTKETLDEPREPDPAGTEPEHAELSGSSSGESGSEPSPGDGNSDPGTGDADPSPGGPISGPDPTES